jgi:carbonic anhydrase
MPKPLFIICPFSCVEPVLQKEFGDAILFLTSPIASIDTSDANFLRSIKCILKTEEITEIKIVNSTSCRFINSVVKGSLKADFQALEMLEKLHQNNSKYDFSGLSQEEKAYKLAEANITFQTLEILQSNILGSYILKNDIGIEGLIISKNNTHFNYLQLTHKV